MSGAGVGYGEVLAMEVLDRLHHLDLLAVGERGYGAADVARIREELARRIAMWRRLLAQHTPRSDGGRYCPVCRCGWRRRRWPCPVWAQAHARMVASVPPPHQHPKTVTARPAAIRYRPPPTPRPGPGPPTTHPTGPAGATTTHTHQQGRHRGQ